MLPRRLILGILVLTVTSLNSAVSVAGNCGQVIGYTVVGPTGTGPVASGPIAMGMPMAVPAYSIPFPVFPRKIYYHVPHAWKTAGSVTPSTRAKRPVHKACADTAELRETQRLNPADRLQLLQQKTAYVLDAATGDIQWNSVLAGEAFAPLRVELAAKLATKSDSVRQLDAQQYQSAAATIAVMKETLRGMIRVVPPQTYCETSQFLTDLQIQLRLDSAATDQQVRR